MDIKIIKSHESVSFHIYLDQNLALAEISKIDKESFEGYLDICSNKKTLQKIKNEIIVCDSYYFFNRLNVPQKLRGGGLGKTLLNQVLNFCRDNNIALMNTVNNYGDMSTKDLIDFYQKSGMTLLDKKGLLVFHSHISLNVKKTKKP